MRKEFYGILPLALTSCLASQTTAQEKQTQRPNVVFIYADDIGYGDLSCNGAKTIHTPNVERLAKMGVRFTNAHSAAATSTPSRYAMLTGEYAWRKAGTGIAAGDAAAIIRPERYTMANLFKDAGYNTGVVGKWHLGLGDKGGEQDWNKPLQPGTNDIGFEYSFIMAATGDRVPCVFVENDQVINLDPNDPYYNYEYAYRTGDTSVIKTDEQKVFFEGLSAYLDAAFEYNTLFEQEKAVHDYMVLNSAYDYKSYQNGTVPAASHTAEGIFVYKTAVCDGYASAFKLCMDILGIPCETITGTADGGGHAWNAVMLDDEWYMVDVTWDDPVPDTPGQVLYGYFNITDEKMKQDHTYTSDIKADGTKYYYLGMQENYFTDAEIDDYYAYISEKASETSGNVTITAMVESTDQEIDSEWLGTFTDSGRLEISYRELSLSVQWSGHIATFTWTLKR